MLSDPKSIASQVFSGYKQMLRARKENPAFHPNAPQQVLDLGDQVFAVFRSDFNRIHKVLCIINITQEYISPDLNPITSTISHARKWTDLISHKSFVTSGDPPKISLEGYQYLWLTLDET
jgi:sucrose phosphorylase